jgi:hypothetical protein
MTDNKTCKTEHQHGNGALHRLTAKNSAAQREGKFAAYLVTDCDIEIAKASGTLHHSSFHLKRPFDPTDTKINYVPRFDVRCKREISTYLFTRLSVQRLAQLPSATPRSAF